MLPALDKRGELFSLLIAECHDVLLHCVLFAGHESDRDGDIESENPRRINDGDN